MTRSRTSILRGRMGSIVLLGGYFSHFPAINSLSFPFDRNIRWMWGMSGSSPPGFSSTLRTYYSDFLTPLPEIVDDVIQQSPIDVRRGLYKVYALQRSL